MILKDKVVVVTGSSRGIGYAIAKKFLSEGAIVIINNSTDSEILEDVTRDLGPNCYGVTADVSNFEETKRMFEEIYNDFGNIDVLVNNAGISHIGLFQDMDLEDWNKIINTNLSSMFNTTKQVIPNMVNNKTGKIINISSIWGNVGASCEVAYSASKGGVNSFTKALAKEIAPSGIYVNAIACGVINTEMNNHLSEKDKLDLAGDIPMSRFGEATEVANLCIYLASSDSSYLTGQVITLDGGIL
ncbi:MAG: SDR family oxidoreductase [Clostridia bacterium]|jgi:3-oxoacyl-[acyl-carrier protein] reductase|nr:SDR family oxidoreductase [Clostridia bacterium]